MGVQVLQGSYTYLSYSHSTSLPRSINGYLLYHWDILTVYRGVTCDGLVILLTLDALCNRNWNFVPRAMSQLDFRNLAF